MHAHDLRDAVALSATYVSLAGLYRRDSMPEKARALCARHVALWREWKSRLPKNSLAQRQLRVARAEVVVGNNVLIGYQPRREHKTRKIKG